MNQYQELKNFSETIIKLLISEAMRVAEAPDFEGLELAGCLISDALKYHRIYPEVNPTKVDDDLRFYRAAQKIKEWDTGQICQF